MPEYNDEYGAYVLEDDEAVICWEEAPGADWKQTAETVTDAYYRNLRHIAKALFAEIGEMFGLSGTDAMLERLGRPTIYPDEGHVVYLDSTLDEIHTVSFEYLDDEFLEIDYISVDG